MRSRSLVDWSVLQFMWLDGKRARVVMARGKRLSVVANGCLWWPHLCAVLVETVEHHDHVETLQRSPCDLQVLARQRTGG